MNFAELKSEAMDILKRPDLDTRLESAIKAATLKLHTASFWTRDIQEKAIKFDPPSVITNFNPREMFPEFRKIAYIRLWNYDETDAEQYGTPGKLLDSIELGDVLDYWGTRKTDVYYEAGELIQVRTAVEMQYTLVGVYAFPAITTERQFNSWIARDYPWAIIHEAVAQVAKQIGFDNLADMQSQEGALQLSILRMQNTQEPNVRI